MDSSDGVTTSDETPFANHLGLVGLNAGSFQPGRVGNAAFLTGNLTYMTNLHEPSNVTGLPIYRAGSYTVAMWVRGAAQTARYLYTEANTAGNNNPLFILQTGQAAGNNSKFDVIIRTDEGGVQNTLIDHVVSTNVVFDNNWHHVAWVDDGGIARLYVDGNLDPANFSYRPSGTFTMHSTVVGNLVRAAVANSAFNGQIDDVAVWERPLTQAEVQEVMNNSLQTPIPVYPLLIVTQPASSTRMLGDRVTFRVHATGQRPFSYQWASNGVDIPGATGQTLMFSNLTVAHSANYTVLVSNPSGSATSTAATLTVLPDPPVDLRDRLVSFWPFEELIFDDPQMRTLTPDVYSRNDINLVPYPYLDQVIGNFGSALGFNGGDQYGVRTAGSPIYNNSGYSISFWVNGQPQNSRLFYAEDATATTNTLVSFGSHSTGANGTMRVFIRNNANVVRRDRHSTRAVLDGTWHHVVWTETNGQARLYIDGVLDETDFDYVRTTPLTPTRSAIAALLRTPPSSLLNGAIDELAVWNRLLTLTEIQELRANSVPAPLGAIPPSITQQPASQSVFTDGTATFLGAAAGTAPLYPQWRKGGANITDATNFSLVLSNLVLADTGDYDLVVTNAGGGVTSQVATLTVTLRPPPPAEFKLDFNNIGAEGPADTQPGFASFAIDAFGPGPFHRTYSSGVDVTVSGAGVNIESRLRTSPVNSPTFTASQIFRDFIFSRDSTTDHGIDVLLSFLEPNESYDATIWSFDATSANNRVSDWLANGSTVQTGYTFDGNVLPTTDGQYQFSFPVQADAQGKVLIQGRRSPSAGGDLNVFINALRLIRRELRITQIHLATDNTLRLTLKLRDPAAGHRLEQKTNLTDANWTEVLDAVFSVPTGDTQEVTVSIPNTSTRFYRAVELP